MQFRFEGYKMKVLYIMLIAVGFLMVATHKLKERERAINQTGSAKIVIKFRGLNPVTKSDVFRTISAPNEVKGIITFIDSQLRSDASWEISDPATTAWDFLTIVIYKGNTYTGSFGIGERFFTSVSGKSSRKKAASAEEFKELLSLIGLSEREYYDLQNTWRKQVYGSH
jgi:hypothetical protein